MSKPPDSTNAYWVTPSVAGGEYPGHAVRAEVAPRVRAWVEQGVTLFVDLTEPGELEPYEAEARDAGARHLRFAIRDASVPRASDLVRDALDAIDAEAARGGRAYVHCWGGVGRTGTVIGCWLVRHGHDGIAALDEVQRLYATTPKVRRIARSPENAAQCDYVLGLGAHPHPRARSARGARSELVTEHDESPLDRALDAIVDASCDPFVRVLQDALVHPHHHRHQRVARELQRAARPSTIPFVRRAVDMGFEHLAYTASEDDVIAKWLSWILAGIGTDEAIALLGELALHENPSVASAMRYRLERLGSR
jgi:protein-tyrosine phosphatase